METSLPTPTTARVYVNLPDLMVQVFPPFWWDLSVWELLTELSWSFDLNCPTEKTSPILAASFVCSFYPNKLQRRCLYPMIYIYDTHIYIWGFQSHGGTPNFAGCSWKILVLDARLCSIPSWTKKMQGTSEVSEGPAMKTWTNFG